MKRIVISSVLAIAACGQVLAADLPEVSPPPQVPKSYFPPPKRDYDWSGVYFGVVGGYGFGTSNWSDLNNPSGMTSTGDFQTPGVVVGGTVGFNYQISPVVLGVETDFDYSRMEGTVSPASGNGFCALTNITGITATSCTTENSWLGLFRGRVGYAIDRVLFYGTGGFAMGNIKAGLTGGGIMPGFDNNLGVGWTAGGGTEVAFADQWTVKFEYLYVSLAQGSCLSAGNCGIDGLNALFAPVAATDSVKFTTNIIRVGINYKFDFDR